MSGAIHAFVVMPFGGNDQGRQRLWTELYEQIFEPALKKGLQAAFPDCSEARISRGSDIDNQDARLRAGSFVRGVVQAGSNIPVLKLPHDVLRPGAQNELFVVIGDTLASRHVVYSVTPTGELLVRRGLSAGERVMRAPKADTHAGERVEIDTTPEKAPKASR